MQSTFHLLSDWIMKKYTLLCTYVILNVFWFQQKHVPTTSRSFRRVYREKCNVVRQITELESNPTTLTVFLSLNFYLSTVVWRLHEWRDDNTDPSGPWSAQNTHITGCLDTSNALQSQYGNLRATPDQHLGNHTNAASKFGWQAAERDRVYVCLDRAVWLCVKEKRKQLNVRLSREYNPTILKTIYHVGLQESFSQHIVF